jgi:hypothetical protein
LPRKSPGQPSCSGWCFFSAFDAVAGIATGVLARHANSLSGDDRAGVVAATDFLFDDSQLVGGGFSVLGNLGHGAWIVLAIAATVALHRAGAFEPPSSQWDYRCSSRRTPGSRPRSG